MANIDQEAVAKYLEELQDAVRAGRYRLALNANREANRKLFLDYVIDEAKAKQILLELDVTDFSERLQNEHRGFEHELLYVFGKEVELLERFGVKSKKVSLYIKFNKPEARQPGESFVIVISCHEQRFPLKYRFR